MLKQFAGGAKQTQLAGDLSAGGTSFTVDDATGYPASATVPHVVAIDLGMSNEEKVLVTRVGDTFTVVTRGYDDTTAQSHSAGATVDHVLDSETVDEANTFVNSGGSLTAPTAGTVVLTITGAVGQTANLQNWRNSGATIVASVGATGHFNATGLTAQGDPTDNTVAIESRSTDVAALGGYGFLYVYNGALRYRGASGTVTVVAPA